MSGNSPGGWGPPQGPPGPWGAPPQGAPQGPAQQQPWGNPQGPAPFGPPPNAYGPPPGAYGPPAGGFGPPPGAYGAPPPYGAPYGGNPYGPPASPGFAYQSSSDTTTAALIMAICSWVLCLSLFLSVPAFFMARSELARIDRGEIGQNNRSNAQAAYWIAVINMGLSLLAIVPYVFFIAIAIATGPR